MKEEDNSVTGEMGWLYEKEEGVKLRNLLSYSFSFPYVF